MERHSVFVKKFGLAFGLIVGLAQGAVNPAWATDASLIERAQELMKICSANMPVSNNIKAALKDAGFRYERVVGGYHVFSLEGRRIVAGSASTRMKEQGCMVSVSKMTPEEANALADYWIEFYDAKMVELNDKDLSGVWIGTRVNKDDVIIVAIKKMDFRIMKGAAVMLLTNK